MINTYIIHSAKRMPEKFFVITAWVKPQHKNKRMSYRPPKPIHTGISTDFDGHSTVFFLQE